MGAKLSKEQMEFLAHHGIRRSEVFNAAGMRRNEYHSRMKDGGFTIAFNVTVCIRGHALRNRHGKCVQCNPAVLAFQRRHHLEQFVYLAHSRTGRLVKVGTSNDLTDRIEQLNTHQYGGYSDWILLESELCSSAGQVEMAIHTAMARYQVDGSYGARFQSCREMFRCAPSVARTAMRRVLGATQ